MSFVTQRLGMLPDAIVPHEKAPWPEAGREQASESESKRRNCSRHRPDYRLQAWRICAAAVGSYRQYAQPCAVLIPQLGRDLPSVTLRQPIPPDLRRRGRCLALRLVEAVELKAFFVRRKLGPSRTSE